MKKNRRGLVFKTSPSYLCPAFERRPVRLGVRTQDFHSCNTGSIPVRATTEIPYSLVSEPLARVFCVSGLTFGSVIVYSERSVNSFPSKRHKSQPLPPLCYLRSSNNHYTNRACLFSGIYFQRIDALWYKTKIQSKLIGAVMKHRETITNDLAAGVNKAAI
jgi:hypothetical protein